MTESGRSRLEAKDVRIDLADKQNSTSVVAAAVIFSSNDANQYVVTTPKSWNAAKPEYEVLGYDVREMRWINN